MTRGEMIIAVNGHRSPFDQRGADAVGALAAFAPVGPIPQAGLAKVGFQRRLGLMAENHALGIGEQQRVARSGNLRGEVLHLGPGDIDHLADVVAVLGQFAMGEHIHGDPARVQPVILEATLPGPADQLTRRGIIGKAAPAGNRHDGGLVMVHDSALLPTHR